MRRKVLTIAFTLLCFAMGAAQDEKGKGVVYFYRLEEAGKIDSGKPKVYLNDKHLLNVPESEYVGFRLPAGKHILRMKPKASEILLTIEADKIYYVRVSETAAGFGFRKELLITSEEQAVFQMRDMKPIQDKNLIDKSLEVIKTKKTH